MSKLLKIWWKRNKAAVEKRKAEESLHSAQSKSETWKPREPSNYLHDPEMQRELARSTRLARQSSQRPIDGLIERSKRPERKLRYVADQTRKELVFFRNMMGAANVKLMTLERYLDEIENELKPKDGQDDQDDL